MNNKEITKKHAETNGSLMKHTKVQLVDIILRKDNIEKELREQLKDVKDNYQRELNKAVNKYRNEVLVRENLEKDYFNLKDNYYTIYDEKATKEITIEASENDADGLNFLAGKTVDFVNKKAFQGTLLAHNDGGVPNMVLNIPELNPYYFGQLVYFFEKACGISGYLLGVNPFDQPGVEAYTKNMFALLGKPGYEDMKAELEKRF